VKEDASGIIMAAVLPKMSPADIVVDAPERNWCLAA
jgi:hypothetical protein